MRENLTVQASCPRNDCSTWYNGVTSRLSPCRVGVAMDYCNFTNFRCVKISVGSDHGAFGAVQISVTADASAITPCIFLS